MAAQEGTRAGEAARARAGTPPAPGAGHGRALARTLAERGREQPLPGGPRRPPRARAGRDRRSRRARLAVADVELDIERFTKAADEAAHLGSAAAVREALSLYPGDLLPENRYDDWAESRATASPCCTPSSRHSCTSSAPRRASASCRSRRARSSAGPASCRSCAGCSAAPALLTLTGVGGAGKTRLGLELARTVAATTATGPCSSSWRPSASRRLVPVAVAAALDVRALPGQNLSEAIRDFLARRSLLLVLDNCEHVIGASADLVDAILRTAGEVTILATSREPLRVSGETVFRVPSLAIPDPEQQLAPEELLRYESVHLFVERAGRALPGFEVDERNAGDVARICFRLDGLPLALELAAGRLGALSPAVIAERLDDRFRLLQGGNRAAPTRQQTLLATLRWSHDLLEPEEGDALPPVGGVLGRVQADAAEAVCADGGLDEAALADVLGRLVEKSLVSAGDVEGTWRYGLLDTVRAYAQDRLAEAGETAELARRHARWTLSFAERERESGAMDVEAANVRAALQTLLEQGPERRASALRRGVSVLAETDRPRRRTAPVRRGSRRRTGANGSCEPRRFERRERSTCRSHRRTRDRACGGGRIRSPPSSATRGPSGTRFSSSASSAIATDTGEEASRWAGARPRIRPTRGLRRLRGTLRLHARRRALDRRRPRTSRRAARRKPRAVPGRRPRRAHPVARQHRGDPLPRGQIVASPDVRGHTAAVHRPHVRGGRRIRARQQGDDHAASRRPRRRRGAARRERRALRDARRPAR